MTEWDNNAALGETTPGPLLLHWKETEIFLLEKQGPWYKNNILPCLPYLNRMQALMTFDPVRSQGTQEALELSWFFELLPNLRTMFLQLSLTQEDGQNSLVGYILVKRSKPQRKKLPFPPGISYQALWSLVNWKEAACSTVWIWVCSEVGHRARTWMQLTYLLDESITYDKEARGWRRGKSKNKHSHKEVHALSDQNLSQQELWESVSVTYQPCLTCASGALTHQAPSVISWGWLPRVLTF